ncbi:MAG: hypothetical protein GY711_03615 [bacterium]|nr:hypothetical protein [bacterium]
MLPALLLALAFPQENQVQESVVEGTISVLDWSSTRHSPSAGSFRLDVRVEGPRINSDFMRRVQVTEGRFKFKLPGHARFRIVNVRADGLAADVEGQPEGRPYAVTAALDLVVRPMLPTTVNVVDTRTEAPIESDLEVVELAPDSDPWIHPGKQKGDRRRNPLKLVPTSLAHGRYLVRAKGYAWQPLEVDPRSGGELQLALAPGGSIEVVTVPSWIRVPWHLRVRRAGEREGPVLFEIRSPRRPIDSLPPGSYTLSAESGDEHKGVVHYGAIDGVVVVGESTRVTLALDAEGRAELAPGHGTVTVPAAWRLGEFDVELSRSSQWLASNARSRVIIPWESLVPVRQAANTFRFDAGDVQVGCYSFRAGSLSGFHFDVTAEGEACHIEIPPPVSATVTLVDARTNEPVVVERARWSNSSDPAGLAAGHPRCGGGTLQPMELDAVGEAYVLRAPRGHIAISVCDWRYAFPVFTPLELERNGERHTVRLEPAQGVLVRFTVGGEPFSPRRMPTTQLVPVGSEQRTHTNTLRCAGGFRADAHAPGHYRIEVAAPEGYRAIPNREITIDADTVKIVEIPLSR